MDDRDDVRPADRPDHSVGCPESAWGGCAYCGVSDAALPKDCVLPVSRRGGYTLSNVVPACASCNASKCNQEVTSWLRRKKLDEGTFLVRQLGLAREVAAAEAAMDSAEAL